MQTRCSGSMRGFSENAPVGASNRARGAGVAAVAGPARAGAPTTSLVGTGCSTRRPADRGARRPRPPARSSRTRPSRPSTPLGSRPASSRLADRAPLRHGHAGRTASKSYETGAGLRRDPRARIERGDLVVALGGEHASAISPVSPRRSSGAACASCSCERRCPSPRSIPRSAATGVNTATARTSSAPSHSGLVLADTAALDTLPTCASAPPLCRGRRNTGSSMTSASSRSCRRTGADLRRAGARPRRRRELPGEGRGRRRDGARTATALLNLGTPSARARARHQLRRRPAPSSRAMAIGMCLAFRFSVRLRALPGPGRGPAAGATSPRRAADLARRGPAAATIRDGLVDAMAQDKKVKDGR